MAAVTLTRAFLLDAASGVQFACFTMLGAQDASQVTGQVRAYAGGRFRAVTRAGVQPSIPVTVRNASLADVNLLRSWHGRVLLLRDTFGRKVYGTTFQTDAKPYRDGSGWDVTFTLTGLSYSEAV